MSIDLGLSPQHPLLACAVAIDGLLDEVAGVEPMFMRTADKKSVLTKLVRLESRLAAVKLRVLARADDIAIETGDRSTATWLAQATRDGHGPVRRANHLAGALEDRWRLVRQALNEGVVNVAQAHVLTKALDDLPTDLDPVLRDKAEAHLVGEATTFGPRELARLGQRVLETIAPEIAERAEYERLVAEQRRNEAATKLFFRNRGDGTTDVHARMPTAKANRLRAYLDGFTAPRSRRLGEVDDLPLSRKRGLAFCALLEGLPTFGLPRQGGSPTTISVRIDWETLRRDLGGAGLATTSTGDTITADEARRMACNAGIIPFVMGGGSVVHDQGRKRRLHTEPHRAALHLLYDECTAKACTIPAAWCEAHHKVPWSRGGRTDLKDATLLCPFHHHRAHDPAWQVNYHHDGTTSFTRRT